jgi:membrane protein implicated in regulation of membrane protease activity
MKNSKRFRALPGELKRRIVVRYAFFQLPDILILVLILLVLRWWTDLSLWVYGCIGGLWVAKEIFLFPIRWKFYEPPRPEERRSLIGREGIAEERLAPSGYVRVDGELWQAEVVGKKAPIEKGGAVFIERTCGFTLLVQPIKKM